jgi:hypothetical protein
VAKYGILRKTQKLRKHEKKRQREIKRETEKQKEEKFCPERKKIFKTCIKIFKTTDFGEELF